MKNNKLFRIAAGLLIAANIFTFTACSQQTASTTAQTADSNGQTTIYGKVTAVDGAKITLALGTFGNQRSGQQGDPSGSRSNTQQGNRPNDGGNGQSGSGSGNEGNAQRGQGNASRSGNTSRQGMPQNGWQGEELTLTGETKTITISDAGVLTRGGFAGGRGQGNGQRGAPDAQNGTPDQSAPAVTNTAANTVSSAESTVDGSNTQKSVSLSDITVGTILRVTYETSGEKLISVQIMGGIGGGQTTSSAQSK